MAKRPQRKTAGKKAAPKRSAPKAKTRAASRAKPKTVRKDRSVTVKLPQSITVSLPPALHDRLKGLSQAMGLSMEGVVRQALNEFADTWEEHHRTVAALADPSDRMQLAVKD